MGPLFNVNSPKVGKRIAEDPLEIFGRRLVSEH